MKFKTILLTLSLILAASSSMAMKKADFIKAGFIIISETRTQLVLMTPKGETVIAVASSNGEKAKDGRDYFVLK